MAKASWATEQFAEQPCVVFDDKIIVCTEYQEIIRATVDQVITDS